MSFFDEIGKKQTDAGQNVAQQTKSFAEVTKLSGAISDKEKQIAQIYAQIGQAYYQRHCQDPGAEEWEQIQSINALLAEIARHREEIKQIKGVTKCPGCGAEVPLHAAYCSACGARVPAEETAAPAAPGTRVCPCCGAPAEADSAFCNSCGTRL